MIKEVVGTALVCGAFITNISMAASIGDSSSNSTFAAAQNIDSSFTMAYSPDIGDAAGNNTSLSSRHVTIGATGDNSYDYFSFSVSQIETIGRFDIDHTLSVDTMIALWDSGGNFLKSNDDSSTQFGANGSTSSLDAFIEHTFSSAGTFVVGVARSVTAPENGGWQSGGNVLRPGDNYTLQVSLESPAPVPVPAAVWLLGSGLVGLVTFGRRRV